MTPKEQAAAVHYVRRMLEHLDTISAEKEEIRILCAEAQARGLNARAIRAVAAKLAMPDRVRERRAQLAAAMQEIEAALEGSTVAESQRAKAA